MVMSKSNDIQQLEVQITRTKSTIAVAGYILRVEAL